MIPKYLFTQHQNRLEIPTLTTDLKRNSWDQELLEKVGRNLANPAFGTFNGCAKWKCGWSGKRCPSESIGHSSACVVLCNSSDVLQWFFGPGPRGSCILGINALEVPQFTYGLQALHFAWVKITFCSQIYDIMARYKLKWSEKAW